MKKASIKTPIVLFLITLFNGFVIDAYSQELIPFKSQMTGKYGYMNESGKIVIKAQFYKVSEFSNGIAIVSDVLTTFYINETGATILKAPSEIESFSNNYGIVRSSGGSYFVNSTGKTISPIYRYAIPFSENIAIVWISGKVMAINKLFKTLFEIEIDPTRYGEYFGQYSDGMMPIKNIQNKWGYINNVGKIVIKPSYIYPGKFLNGYAIVYSSELKWHVINKVGDSICSFNFKESFDYQSKNCFLIKDKLIFRPKTGIIRIVSLVNNSSIDVKIKMTENEEMEKKFICPIILKDYIFYDGKIIDLDGKIVWQIDKFKKIETTYYNKYILVEKTDNDFHLYKYDGTEISFP